MKIEKNKIEKSYDSIIIMLFIFSLLLGIFVTFKAFVNNSAKLHGLIIILFGLLFLLINKEVKLFNRSISLKKVIKYKNGQALLIAIDALLLILFGLSIYGSLTTLKINSSSRLLENLTIFIMNSGVIYLTIGGICGLILYSYNLIKRLD